MQHLTSILCLFIMPLIANTAVLRYRVEQSSFFTLEPIQNGPICELGEGPYYDPITKALYYVDAFVGTIHRFDTETQNNTEFKTGKLASIVIPIEGSDNELIITQYDKIFKLNWETKVLTEIASAPKRERFNDAKVDSKGRLWIGTIKMDADDKIVPLGGALYKLVNNQLVVMSSNYSISNGMAWNKNNTLMFFNDSEDQKTFVFDFDLEEGTIKNRRLLIDYKNNEAYKDEYPDGMAIDKNGEIWIALYNGGRIIRISQTGALLASVNVPAQRPTSLAFGGEDYRFLYVTTGNETSTPEKYPQAGKVFKVSEKDGAFPKDQPQILGIPPNRLKI